MYPDLSYFFHDLLGTDYDNWTSIFKTFGLLLATALGSAGYIFYLELLRKEKEGGPLSKAISKAQEIIGEKATWKDAIPGVITGFILGFKLPHIFTYFEAFKINPAAIIFSLEGTWFYGILGAVLLGGYYFWQKKSEELPKPKINKFDLKPSDRVGDLLIVGALSGILGAKLFAMVETLDDINSANEFFAQLFSGSGLAIYGGLIGGFIGVAIYIRNMNIPMIHLMDAAAPAMVLGQAVGRLGCHLSGDGDWGIVATEQPDWWFLPDWLWSYDYPNNVNEGNGAYTMPLNQDPNQQSIDRALTDCEDCRYQWKLGAKVYPTSVYEFGMLLSVFGIIWGVRKKIAIPGMIFFLYMVMVGIERWFIEKIRVNDIFAWGLTQAEVISIMFFTIGIGGMGYLWAKRK